MLQFDSPFNIALGVSVRQLIGQHGGINGLRARLGLWWHIWPQYGLK
jgi:hypothetical protein